MKIKYPPQIVKDINKNKPLFFFYFPEVNHMIQKQAHTLSLKTWLQDEYS